MCMIASVLDDYVHDCFGFGRLWCIIASVLFTMCIIALVLDDYVQNCVGFGRQCA